MGRKVVLAGRDNLSIACLDALLKNDVEELDVTVVPARMKQRDPTQKNLRNWARDLKVSIFDGDINDLPFDPDIIFSVLYDRRFDQKTLEKSECINLHTSPLPRYGGFNQFYWAIRNGDERYGVTLHKMELEFDTGDIIAQRMFKIHHSETARHLYEKAHQEAAEMFRAALPSILAGNYKTTPQDLSQRTFNPKNAVDFSKPISLDDVAKRVYDNIRASIFPPFPNPFVVIDGKEYRVVAARISKQNVRSANFISEDEVRVPTKEGSLILDLETDRPIIYSEREPSLEQFKKIRQISGWGIEERGVSDERVIESLNSSPYCVSAWKGEKLIGVCRLSGDNGMYGYIQDVMVLPGYQRKGIASKMIKRLLEKVRDKKGYLLGVCPSRTTAGLYERVGFKKRPENPNGFMFKEIK